MRAPSSPAVAANFHCLPLTFHCLSLTFHYPLPWPHIGPLVSLPFTAFRGRCNGPGEIIGVFWGLCSYWATTVALDGSHHVWQEPYTFSGTGFLGTTISAPVFDRTGAEPRFIGVVGMDMYINVLENALGQSDADGRRIVLEALNAVGETVILLTSPLHPY